MFSCIMQFKSALKETFLNDHIQRYQQAMSYVYTIRGLKDCSKMSD